MASEGLDKASVLKLLRSTHPSLEEHFMSHSWCNQTDPPFPGPLLRIWDCCSGSCPDTTKKMLARSPRKPLRSCEERKEALATHANHHTWKPTPFISVSSSPLGIEAFFQKRKWVQPPQLVVINPYVRIAKGLPVLSMKAEMDYYGVKNPYSGRGDYYTDQYICLWEVTPEEVVIGSADFEKIRADPRWYENFVLPAFERHHEKFLRERQAMERFDLSVLQSALPDLHDSGDSISLSSGNSSGSSQGDIPWSESSGDTDHGLETDGMDDLVWFWEMVIFRTMYD